MIGLLKELNDNGIILEEVNGELKLFSKSGAIEEDMLNRIRENKDKIIEQLGRNKNLDSETIPLTPQQESYPLSTAQSNLWITSQFEDGSVAYNMPLRVHLYGDYDIENFRKAVHAVIDRHEILRTVFRENEEGQMRQFIVNKKELSFTIEYHDFSANENANEAVETYINEDSYRRFDLENGPLLRAALLQLSDSEMVFYYNMHHIISDAWSLEVLASEIMTHYNSYTNKTPLGLSPLKIQHKDYTVWQLDQISGEGLRSQREYWLQKLSGSLPLLDLPTTKMRPKLKTYNGELLRTYLSSQDVIQLNKFSEAHGGSLFMGVLAVLKILLYRYSGQKDIIIGSPIAGRSHPDLQNQIGFYLNTLTLRDVIDPASDFEAFFDQIKTSTIQAFQNQKYPMHSLITDLDLVYNQGRSYLFDMSLTFHNVSENHDPSGETSEYFDEIVSLGFKYPKQDMEFHFQEIGEGLSFEVIYNTDVYELEMVETLMKHFKQLLSQLLKDTTTSIGSIDFLTKAETQKLLSTDYTIEVQVPEINTLVDLFAKQAAKVPNATALVYEDIEMSYEALDQQTNRLAHCLQTKYHVQKGDLVGIKLDRGLPFIVSMIAVLKAGAAYVPVDPEYPENRKAWILEDSGTKLLITDSSYMFDLDYYDGDLLTLDIDFDAALYSSEALDISIVESDLAYVIYTSGSTGMPKGVMVEHRGIVNTIIGQIEVFRLSVCKRSLQFASFSFDASVSEIFITLLTGSALYIVDGPVRKNPELLSSYIAENKIDIVTLPPSYLKVMEIEEIKNLKMLITAGEPPIYDKVMSFVSHGGYFCNAYGPTETSILGSLFPMNEATQLIDKIIPIGTPIPNVQMLILSPENCLQPQGVIGEICIGGAGLSRGYLNRPELTEEKFIEHPYQPGERLYKTGDVGRRLSDGNVEFMGRVDDQVKIRGNRVEPGEIVHHLESKEDIKEAAILVRKGEDGDNQLAAYLVSENEQTVSVLRHYLSERLPDYMLPSHYVQVEKIPLNTNGKVDAVLLPKLKGIVLSTGVEYVAPRNETEEIIVKIWEDVLQKEKIGIHDDFFDLGGQSILVVKLISRINKELGVMFDFKDVFTERTIAALSDYLETTKKLDQQDDKVVETDKKLTF